jgi:hypothetical protein
VLTSNSPAIRFIRHILAGSCTTKLSRFGMRTFGSVVAFRLTSLDRHPGGAVMAIQWPANDAQRSWSC